MKDLGLSLAIYDFGSGYSSFASLKNRKVDSLKIDKYFIDGLLIDNTTNHLVGSMIEKSHNLGHQIIAEGVETIEQFIELNKLGCEISQGYLHSKPRHADDVLKLPGFTRKVKKPLSIS